MKFDCSCIIPECYADTNLVQTLLQMRGANHQKSCGQVTKELLLQEVGLFERNVIAERSAGISL